MTEAKVCCICNEKFIGWGSNPYPVKEDGECCKPCDDNVVIPARIKEYSNMQKTESFDDIRFKQYEKEKNELN
jgi:hypothetical protein